MERLYTFEDWLEDEFHLEKTFADEYVCNDSENYLDLVGMKKMTYDELNKIQDAQKQAYNYMVDYSLFLNQKYLYRLTKESLDLKKVVEQKIDEIEGYFSENKSIYGEVIFPMRHRAMKKGAKFMIPQAYISCKDGKISDAYRYEEARYQTNINGSLTRFPTPEQMRYVQMEVKVLWQNWLREYLVELTLMEKNLLDLQENNQEYERLVLDIYNREQIAGQFLSSTEFIESEIDIFLETMKKPVVVSVEVNNMPTVSPFNVFEYSAKAYEYLIRGYNMPIKRLIDDALKDCEEEKKKQLKQHNKLYAFVPCDDNFPSLVLGALKRGVGFAMYIKYLKDKIKNKPFLIGIDLKETQSEIAKRKTRFDKIEYLKWLIDYSGIEKGIKYYSDHNNHHETTPDIWSGLLSAKAGLRTFDAFREKAECEKGASQWNIYCEVKQWISDMENGKRIIFPKDPDLASIFSKPEYYEFCLSLLEDLEVIKNTGKPLTKGKGFILFAIIEGLKKSSCNLLNRPYTDDELLSFFNIHLGTSFKQLKRKSKGFNEKLSEVKELINSNFKK
jgi:hypothetical protein